jgi:regulator of replication initiation timing
MTDNWDTMDKDHFIDELKTEIARLEIENVQLRRELGNLTFRGVSEQIKTENECKQSQKLLLSLWSAR